MAQESQGSAPFICRGGNVLNKRADAAIIFAIILAITATPAHAFITISTSAAIGILTILFFYYVWPVVQLILCIAMIGLFSMRHQHPRIFYALVALSVAGSSISVIVHMYWWH